MKMEEREKTYIQRMIEYCDRIIAAKERFGETYEHFLNDADYRDVVCMNLFQIGELANQISDEIRENFQDIPWNKMYGIRNILAHAYIKIDYKIIWETVINDLSELREKLMEI